MAITRLTGQNAAGTSNGASVSATYPGATTVGNMLTAAVYGASNATIAMTGWTPVVSANAGAAANGRIAWFRKVADGTETTVTATLTGAAAMRISIFETSGVDTVAPVDNYVSNTSNTTSVATLAAGTAALDTQNANDLLMSAWGFNGNTSAWSVNSSFSVHTALATGRMVTAERSVTATGAYNPTLSWTTAQRVGAAMIALRETSLTATPNVIVNGAFSTDAAWVGFGYSGKTISGGKANFAASPAYDGFIQSGVPFTAGKYYEVTFTVSGRTSGNVYPFLTGGTQRNGTIRSADGTYTERLLVNSGNNAFNFQMETGGTLSVDDITVTGPFNSPTVGVPNTPQGVGAGSWTFVGTATGVRAPKATGAGSWVFVGAAAGERTPKATGSGSWSFTGTAAGSRTPKATGAGTWTWTGAAVGSAPVVAGPGQGSGTGSWSFAGSGTGRRVPKASGGGSFAFSGSASGKRSAVGVAAGIWSFAGSAAGKRAPKATGAGAWSFSGAAVGTLTAKGSGSGAWTYVGAATGIGRDPRPHQLAEPERRYIVAGENRTLTIPAENRRLTVAAENRTVEA